jgi:hypothetical protein
MILIYDVNDGIWESKGNFQTAQEDNDDITIHPTNDGKFNLDILCVSLLSNYKILSEIKKLSLSSLLLLSISAHFHFKQVLFPLLQVLVLRPVLLPQTIVLNQSLPLP